MEGSGGDGLGFQTAGSAGDEEPGQGPAGKPRGWLHVGEAGDGTDVVVKHLDDVSRSGTLVNEARVGRFQQRLQGSQDLGPDLQGVLAKYPIG